MDSDKGQSPVELMGSNEISDPDGPPPNDKIYLTGWRLHFTTLGIVFSLLLVNIEVSIVGTSLVAITNDLQGFSETSWIVNGYLVTYMGFMILWGKLSDIYGRKTIFIASMVIFTAWSGGCGGSKTMTQLIICRAFQGVGGAGAYAIATVMTYEMVPPDQIGKYGAFNAISVAVATLMGPLFGGLINNHTTWRWVFYLNLPAGAVVLAFLMFGIPNGFPYHNRSPSKEQQEKQTLQSLKRLDLVGATMLLAGSLLLSASLLEVSLRRGWRDAGSIILLVFGILSWIAFFAWQWYVSSGKTKQEPLFPWAFVLNRPWMGFIISAFLSGIPFNVIVIFLPQRLQTVSGVSPFQAGLRLLPYTFSAAFGATLSMIMGSKRRIAVIYILLLGASFQTVGIALFSTLPTTSEWPDRGYGYSVIAGVGMGITYGICVLAAPFVVEKKYTGLGGPAILQFRFLGGVIGVAIAANVFNSRLESGLRGLLSASSLARLHEDTRILQTLPTAIKAQVVAVFAREYNYQNKIMIAFTAAQLLSALIVLNKKWSKLGQSSN